jgi:hypothetical protein
MPNLCQGLCSEVSQQKPSPTLSIADNRSDILHRHELIHTVVSGDSTSPRRKRACIECARARERCTKGTPCSRCSSKSLECIYPQESSEKRPAPLGEQFSLTKNEWKQGKTQDHWGTSSQYSPTVTSPLTAGSGGQTETNLFDPPTVSNPFQPSTKAYSELGSYSEDGSANECNVDMEFISPLEPPSSISDLFKQSKFMTPNPFLAYHQSVEYQQPISSSMAWILTSQPAGIGYDPALDLSMASYPYQESSNLSPYPPDPMATQESMITTDEQSMPYISTYGLNQPSLPLMQASLASPVGTMSPISQPRWKPLCQQMHLRR